MVYVILNCNKIISRSLRLSWTVSVCWPLASDQVGTIYSMHREVREHSFLRVWSFLGESSPKHCLCRKHARRQGPASFACCPKATCGWWTSGANFAETVEEVLGESVSRCAPLPPLTLDRQIYMGVFFRTEKPVWVALSNVNSGIITTWDAKHHPNLRSSLCLTRSNTNVVTDRGTWIEVQAISNPPSTILRTTDTSLLNRKQMLRQIMFIYKDVESEEQKAIYIGIGKSHLLMNSNKHHLWPQI